VVWSLDFAENDSRIISGGVDKKIKIWDIENETELASFDASERHIREVNARNDANIAVSASLDGIARFWDTRELSEFGGIEIDHGADILTANFSNSGDTVVTAGRDNAFRLWKMGRSSNFEDETVLNVGGRALAYLEDVAAFPGDSVKLRVNFEGIDYSSDDFKYEFLLEIPTLLMDAEGINKSPKDTILISGEGSYSGISIELPALVLKGDTKSDSLRLVAFKAIENEKAKFDTKGSLLTVLDSCSDSRHVLVDNQFGLFISPNPVKDVINIEFESAVDGIFDVIITSLDGELVTGLGNWKISPGKNYTVRDLSGLNQGAYLLVISNERKVISEKFIRQK
jgi:hypothetical protein